MTASRQAQHKTPGKGLLRPCFAWMAGMTVRMDDAGFGACMQRMCLDAMPGF